MSIPEMVALVILIAQGVKEFVRNIFKIKVEKYLSLAIVAATTAGVMAYFYITTGGTFVLADALKIFVTVFGEAALGKAFISGIAKKIRR